MKAIFILLLTMGPNDWKIFERVGTFSTMKECIAAAEFLDKQPYAIRSRGDTKIDGRAYYGPDYRCAAALE